MPWYNRFKTFMGNTWNVRCHRFCNNYSITHNHKKTVGMHSNAKRLHLSQLPKRLAFHHSTCVTINKTALVQFTGLACIFVILAKSLCFFKIIFTQTHNTSIYWWRVYTNSLLTTARPDGRVRHGLLAIRARQRYRKFLLNLCIRHFLFSLQTDCNEKCVHARASYLSWAILYENHIHMTYGYIIRKCYNYSS